MTLSEGTAESTASAAIASATVESATTRHDREAGCRVTATRLVASDESWLIGEEKLGFRTANQYVWVLPRDPGVAAVQRLNHRLARGLLHRAIIRPVVPVARPRWVRSPAVPMIVEIESVDDADVGALADSLLRGARLYPSSGQAWRLYTAPTSAGGRFVCLLVSHIVVDGEGLSRAVSAAASGAGGQLPQRHTSSGLAAVSADLVDAWRQLRSAVTAVRTMLGPHTGDRPPVATQSGPPERPTPPTSLSYDPARVCLATLDLDPELWDSRAAAYGGTSNTLFTAVAAGVRQRSASPHGDPLRVNIAVSKRGGDDDHRANASGGIVVRHAARESPYDLTDLRAASKARLVEYARSGDDIPDDEHALVRLMPRRVLTAMLTRLPSPDLSVSNLGSLPDEVRTVFGVDPSRFVGRLLIRGPVGSEISLPGPGLSAWLVRYGDRMSLTLVAFPPIFTDEDEFRLRIEEELSAWGLGCTLW